MKAMIFALLAFGLAVVGCGEPLPAAAPGTGGPYSGSEFREIHDNDKPRFRKMNGPVTIVDRISGVRPLINLPGTGLEGTRRYWIILGEDRRGEFFVFQYVTCRIDDTDGSKGVAELQEGDRLAIVGIPVEYSPGALSHPNSSAPSLEDCDLSPYQ